MLMPRSHPSTIPTTVGIKKRTHNVIMLQNTTAKLQCIATTHVLHKTTNASTQNYRPYCTKLSLTTLY